MTLARAQREASAQCCDRKSLLRAESELGDFYRTDFNILALSREGFDELLWLKKLRKS